MNGWQVTIRWTIYLVTGTLVFLGAAWISGQLWGTTEFTCDFGVTRVECSEKSLAWLNGLVGLIAAFGWGWLCRADFRAEDDLRSEESRFASLTKAQKRLARDAFKPVLRIHKEIFNLQEKLRIAETVANDGDSKLRTDIRALEGLRDDAYRHYVDTCLDANIPQGHPWVRRRPSW